MYTVVIREEEAAKTCMHGSISSLILLLLSDLYHCISLCVLQKKFKKFQIIFGLLTSVQARQPIGTPVMQCLI